MAIDKFRRVRCPEVKLVDNFEVGDSLGCQESGYLTGPSGIPTTSPVKNVTHNQTNPHFQPTAPGTALSPAEDNRRGPVFLLPLSGNPMAIVPQIISRRYVSVIEERISMGFDVLTSV